MYTHTRIHTYIYIYIYTYIHIYIYHPTAISLLSLCGHRGEDGRGTETRLAAEDSYIEYDII